DHDTVKALLDRLVTLPDETAKEEREQLIDEIRDELIPHSRAEEAVFYNTLRTFEELRSKMRHAMGEHLNAETLLRTLQVKDKFDADWKKTAESLKDALEHHIEEEEGEIFAMARNHI